MFYPDKSSEVPNEFYIESFGAEPYKYEIYEKDCEVDFDRREELRRNN